LPPMPWQPEKHLCPTPAGSCVSDAQFSTLLILEYLLLSTKLM
jgi:hypothetical protein